MMSETFPTVINHWRLRLDIAMMDHLNQRRFVNYLVSGRLAEVSTPIMKRCFEEDADKERCMLKGGGQIARDHYRLSDREMSAVILS